MVKLPIEQARRCKACGYGWFALLPTKTRRTPKGTGYLYAAGGLHGAAAAKATRDVMHGTAAAQAAEERRRQWAQCPNCGSSQVETVDREGFVPTGAITAPVKGSDQPATTEPPELAKHLGPLRALLPAGEQVRAALLGQFERKGKTTMPRTGCLVITDRRLVFGARKRGGVHIDELPLRDIGDVVTDRGLRHRKISFTLPGETAVLSWVRNGDTETFAALVRGAVQVLHSSPDTGQAAPSDRGESPGPSPDSPPSSEPAALIRQLAALRDEGLLSEAEFAAKKAEILDRL